MNSASARPRATSAALARQLAEAMAAPLRYVRLADKAGGAGVKEDVKRVNFMRKDRGDGSDAARTVLECVGKLRRHRDRVKIRGAEDRLRRANRLLDISQAEMRRAGLLRYGDDPTVLGARGLEIRAANVPPTMLVTMIEARAQTPTAPLHPGFRSVSANFPGSKPRLAVRRRREPELSARRGPPGTRCRRLRPIYRR